MSAFGVGAAIVYVPALDFLGENDKDKETRNKQDGIEISKKFPEGAVRARRFAPSPIAGR
jgi:hypothetical protein